METDRRGETVIVIKNHNVEPVVLEEDQAVGTGEAIEIVQPAGGVSNQLSSHGCFSCSVDNNRRVQLLQALRLEATLLTLDQRDQLAALVLKYADVFALTAEELGVTSAMQHQIETGDSSPIRQYLWRILCLM